MAFMLIPGHSKVVEIDQNVDEVPDGVSLVVNVAKEVRSVKLAELPLASRLASVAVRNKGAEMILQSVDFEDGEYRLEAGCYVVLGCKSKWQVLARGVAGVEVKGVVERAEPVAELKVDSNVEGAVAEPKVDLKVKPRSEKSITALANPKDLIPMTAVKVLKTKP